MKKFFLIGFSLLFLGGCASNVVLPDGTEVPADEYRAQKQEQHQKDIAQRMVIGVADVCDAENMDKEQYNTCRWGNVTSLLIAKDMAGNFTHTGYWQKQQADRQFYMNVATLLFNNPFTNAFAQKWAYGGGYGGGGDYEFNFGGDRTARAGGSSGGGEGGNTPSASASGGDTFSGDIFVNAGPRAGFYHQNEGNLATGKDSQVQTGNGLQGQLNTRPNSQPGLDTGGGDNTLDSQGFGVDAGIQ